MSLPRKPGQLVGGKSGHRRDPFALQPGGEVAAEEALIRGRPNGRT